MTQPSDPYLQRAWRAIETATAGMSPAQLAIHPAGKWCAAEILEHLSLAFSSTARLLDKVLQSGERRITPPTPQQRLAAATVITLGHMPTGTQAPEFTVPRGSQPETAVESARESLWQMAGIIGACEARFGKRVKIANHRIFGPLSVSQWRKFHWVHTRHHVKQILALRKG